MNDSARETFIQQLNDNEEWLFEDGYDAEKVSCAERLKNLEMIGDPVCKRAKEAEQRPKYIRELNRGIAEARALSQSKDKKHDHISQEERAKIIKKCDESEEWLTNQLKKQDPLSLADDPILLCKTLDEKKNEVGKFCASIMNKP